MNRTCLLPLILLTLSIFSYPQENFRIFPSNFTQTEPSVTISPVDSNLLFASSRTIKTSTGFSSEGLYVSTNGGLSWFGSDSATGQPIQNHGGDPSVMIHPNGRLITTHIGNLTPGLYSHYSTNLGTSWSNAYTISSQQTEDKGSATVDNFPSSPHYGTLYSCWVNIATPFPVLFSKSTNGGDSWSATKTINSPPPARSSGGYIKTGRDGTIYTCWSGMTSSTPFIEDFAGFAFSSDGGDTWNVNQNIFDMNGIAGKLPTKSNIRVNGLPQIEVDKSNGSRSGWLYIVTIDTNLSPAGSDADIILHRSTDGGSSWSEGIRVNQDPLNNGKIQFFPAMDIDEGGGINIIYYDDRNTTSDSAEVMLARSTDGGNTWEESIVSDHRFKPKPILGGASTYQGDHIALLYAHKKLYCMWMDDYSGLYQVWLKIINIEVNDAGDETASLPVSFSLNQNYPNPFNPSTQISYQLPTDSKVVLEVYSLLGERIAVLVDEDKSAGIHSVSFSHNSVEAKLSSGVYFYKLTAVSISDKETHTMTKKMLLLK